MQNATLASGCFWCTEAIYQNIQGIHSLKSGYSGGHDPNPSYQSVSSQKSGHAEAVHFSFDPNIIPYHHILLIFWLSHDPTSLNRQGNDIGTHYRSAIFFHNPNQKLIASQSMQQYQKSCSKPIVTQITPFTHFYPAEKEHQNYYQNHPYAPYCQFIIKPKLQKLQKFITQNPLNTQSNDAKNTSHP